jgi:hypothetical protein
MPNGLGDLSSRTRHERHRAAMGDLHHSHLNRMPHTDHRCKLHPDRGWRKPPEVHLKPERKIICVPSKTCYSPFCSIAERSWRRKVVYHGDSFCKAYSKNTQPTPCRRHPCPKCPDSADALVHARPVHPPAVRGADPAGGQEDRVSQLRDPDHRGEVLPLRVALAAGEAGRGEARRHGGGGGRGGGGAADLTTWRLSQYALTTRRPGKAVKCLTFCVKTSTPRRRAVAAIWQSGQSTPCDRRNWR